MLPSSYVNFFSTSSQVSAALIGLLFVSVSIERESVFGRRASLRRQLIAVSAFTALVNTFFLSLTAIVPTANLGPSAITVGVLAVISSATDALAALRSRSARLRMITISFAALSAALYGWEVALGVVLLHNGADAGALGSLITVVLAAYALGLSRAWQLLGAGRSHSMLGRIRVALRRDGSDGSDEDKGPLEVQA